MNSIVPNITVNMATVRERFTTIKLYMMRFTLIIVVEDREERMVEE
jgi:hypothetical protein